VKNTPVCLIKPRISDPVWSILLKIKHIYLRGRKYKMNNGKLISFWLDPWLGDDPICKTYPILYDLCLDQRNFVHEVAEAG
jgi:hypothetical protein